MSNTKMTVCVEKTKGDNYMCYILMNL